EVVIDHALRRAGLVRDLVDARAAQSLDRELLGGDFEDVRPGALSVRELRRRARIRRLVLALHARILTPGPSLSHLTNWFVHTSLGRPCSTDAPWPPLDRKSVV